MKGVGSRLEELAPSEEFLECARTSIFRPQKKKKKKKKKKTEWTSGGVFVGKKQRPR